MIKRAPSRLRILTMALFTISCFGLLLFLWASFGGSVPFHPRGYRFQVAFPEAAQLGDQGDVRMAGVPIGKVVHKQLDPDGSRTLATLEIESRYAPIARDTRAILRQKTLIGETYVELSQGTVGGPRLPEGGRLPDGSVDSTVQLDEIFSALDPSTRQALRTWQQSVGAAVARRGSDLNAAIGQLPTFVDEGSTFFGILDQRAGELRTLIHSTGVVFDRLSADDAALKQLVSSSADAFGETARHQARLAETIRILPTFLDESRATLHSAAHFATVADPAVRDLGPSLRRLRPAAVDLAALAPDLRRLSAALDPLIVAGRRGLPAATEVIDGLRPVFHAVVPFLSELNPILQWLEYDQRVTIGLFNAPEGLADTVDTPDGRRQHYLRSFAPAGLESVGIFRQRLAQSRGNTYMPGAAYDSPKRQTMLDLPSWDCANTGKGEFVTEKGGTSDAPSCWRMGYPGWEDQPGVFPHIERADYLRSSMPKRSSR